MIASVSNVPLLLNEHQPPSDICEDAEFKVFVAGSGTSVSLFIYRFHDSEYCWLFPLFIPIVPLSIFPPPGVRLDYRSCESLEEILKSVRFNLINLRGAELEENVSSL